VGFVGEDGRDSAEGIRGLRLANWENENNRSPGVTRLPVEFVIRSALRPLCIVGSSQCLAGSKEPTLHCSGPPTRYVSNRWGIRLSYSAGKFRKISERDVAALNPLRLRARPMPRNTVNRGESCHNPSRRSQPDFFVVDNVWAKCSTWNIRQLTLSSWERAG
jgi:hypothetical protein